MGRKRSVELVPRDPEAEIEAIRADVLALEQRDLEIVRAMDRFADDDELFAMDKKEDGSPDGYKLDKLSDRELEQRGWTRRQLKIARAANLPRADVPYALQAAHERTLARVRRHGEDQAGVKINVSGGTFNILPPAPRAAAQDVIVVEPDRKK